MAELQAFQHTAVAAIIEETPRVTDPLNGAEAGTVTIYLDRKKKVRKIRLRMVPRRISGCLLAHSVLELPAGAIESTGTQPGDQLSFEERDS